ncbi:hypothetical protein MDUV_01270 [Mycolicibacterium duvalii]|uniref:Uncharacterized protein n=1 Tax=Mycolicibacterium duvalii TaxID=39688 RepID=A0A7I7JTU3_9MYCO|nr:hypothetical protein MDUV_01270 [Mycolicibacterium duvalii]
MPPKCVYTAMVDVPAREATLRALTAPTPSRSSSSTPAATKESRGVLTLAMLP